MSEPFNAVIERCTVLPRLAAQNMACAIEELVDAMVADGSLDSALRDLAVKTVAQRELSASTAMGDGIAMPHGRLEQIDRLMCAVGLSQTGFVDAPSGGQKVDIVVLLLVPALNGVNHIHFMARLSVKLLDAALRERLLAATDRQSVRQLLQFSAPA
ncbi:MAG: PTS sugar transporter subunit IIA [Kiritimatiellia bacterium]|nr:PTS sugar transporter subunit IIA [Kiritimatiellia bacterium]